MSGEVLLMLACGLGTAADSPDPLAVTPRDTSANTLRVVVTISEDQDATDKMTDITFSFSTTAIDEKNTVLFDDPNEAVKCGAFQLPLATGQPHILHVTRGHYACIYSGNRNGEPLHPVLMFDIAPRSELAPQPPTITSNGFSVRYTPDLDDRCTVQGKATDSAGDPFIMGPPEPSNEGIYSGPSTSSLHRLGDLFLIRKCVWHHYQPGESHASEFDDMDVTYISQASVEVTWSH
jgi:hypothetical protein